MLRISLLILFVGTCCSFALSQVSITPTGNSCSCDGALSYTSGIAQNAYYEWSDVFGNVIFQEINADGLSTASGLCAGAYFLHFDDGSGVQEFLWNVPSSINPGEAAMTSICETGGNFTLSSLVYGYQAGGIWADLSGNNVSNLQNPSNLNGTELFIYTMTDGACAVQTAVEIFIIENADPGQSTTYLICENYVPFLMTDLLSGSPDFGGQWFDAQGNAISGYYDPAVMDQALFTYMLDIVPGCNPVFSSLFVIENQLSDAGLDNAELICSNASPVDMHSLLNGSPDAGGMWFDSNSNPVDPLFVPEVEMAGTYTYVVPGATPCPSVSSNLELSLSAVDPAGTSSGTLLCSSDSEVNLIDLLDGNPLTGGFWTDPVGNPSDGTFDPSTDLAGEYHYQITIGNCPPELSTSSLSLENFITAGNDQNLVFCETELPIDLTTYLSADATPGGYWLLNGNPLGSSVFSNFSEGNYALTYAVEGLACPDDASEFPIQIEASPISLLDMSITICENEVTLDLNDLLNISEGVVNWTDEAGATIGANYPVNGPENSVLHATAYSGNTCPDSFADIALQVDEINAEVPLQGETCETNEEIDLNSYLPSGTENSGYWTDSQNENIGSFVDPEGNGNEIYHYIIDAVNSCGAGIFELTLEVFELLSAGNDWSAEFCPSSSEIEWPTSQMETEEGGTWSYLGVPVSENLFNPSIMSAGEYVYTTSSNGPCLADEAVFTAVVLSPIQFEAGNDMMACHGDAQVQLGQPANQECTYSWSPGSFLSNSNIADPFVTFENSGADPISVEYVVVVTDEMCAATDTLMITINPKCNVTLSGDNQYCEGETGILTTAGNAISFDWEPFVDQNSSQVVWEVGEDLNVSLLATNAFGCSEAVEMFVDCDPIPELLVNSSPLHICPPIEVILDAIDTTDTASSFVWYMNGISVGTNQNSSVTLSESGDYHFSVVASTPNGCVAEMEVPTDIYVPTVPIAAFLIGPENLTTLDEFVHFENTSLNYNELQWDLWNGEQRSEEEFDIEITPEMNGTYEVCLLVSNDLGCHDSVCHFIHIDPEVVFFAPNAFTPDNDGINDYFQVQFKGFDPESYHLTVVDRWGIVCFDSTDPKQVWMGDISEGKYYAQIDSYVWTVTLKEEHSAREYAFNGSVTIIR